MKRILIVGVSGFLGSHLAAHLRSRHLVYGTFYRHRPAVDGVPSIRFPIHPHVPVTKLIPLFRPDIIFYCAEVTGDKPANEDPLGTLFINGEAPAQLADALVRSGGHLVHFSTARVFGGDRGRYAPEDAIGPAGIYAKTKAQGERSLAQRENTRIVRLGQLYGWGPAGRPSLLRLALEACRRGESAPMESGPYLSFDYVRDVVAKVEDFMEYGDPILHLTSGSRETVYSFAQAVGRAFHHNVSHLVPKAPAESLRGRDWSLAPSPSPGPLRGLTEGLEAVRALARSGQT